MKLSPNEAPELANLVALGFGPEANLMTEPRLFVDELLLGALIVEFEDELGYEEAARTLFQIGLVHGLRDADRVVATGFLFAGPGAAEEGAPAGADGFASAPFHARVPLSESPLTPGGSAPLPETFPTWTPLVMDFEVPKQDAQGFHICGSWPEHHEAGSWLAKLGPGDNPTCWLSCGYTSGWLSGTLDADVIALESNCAVQGDEACRWVAREPAAWEACADDGARAALQTLGPVDFDVYRALALRCPTGPAQQLAETRGDFDPEAPLVHIWGPVMVLPFTGPDEILRTSEALSRDPGTSEIRAVVVDLRGAPIDSGFGAASIERVLETIETWGAEPILTGVGIYAEEAIASLETLHLLVRKDLSEAIAAAFQIAEAQRHVV